MSRNTQNRLAAESSPYLLQHAGNPVDWYPWGPEALERARAEEKPLLVSIGYSSCHWCHVMERESFQDQETAALMNEHFVCVKVDREERPDLDEVYMAATQAMAGRGGWPMNVFCTPEGKPFYAGTYFPPEDRETTPGFPTVLAQMTKLWQDRRGDLVAQADRLVARLARQASLEKGRPRLERGLIDEAVAELEAGFDERHGGFGGAPKFPPATALRFLLQRTQPRALEMAHKTLEHMAAGGLQDHVGAGFFRYSTDERWLVPHFEKMLYDNALLARVYLEAGGAFVETGRRTLDFLLAEMQAPEGGFFSAFDAESEGEEGAFYVFDPAEITTLLGEEAGARFCQAYDITPEGNWEGRSIPNRLRGRSDRLEPERQKVYEARSQRPRPAIDDKVLTAWNGLALSALAIGHRVTGEARYLEAARAAADFLLKARRDSEGRLLRTARVPGFLEDYAFLAEGLLELHRAGAEACYLDAALELAERMLADFQDPESGGFFDTAAQHEKLFVRPHTGHDGSLPSPNATAAAVLADLAQGRPEWLEEARRAVGAHAAEMRRQPAGFTRALMVLDALETEAGSRGGRATAEGTAAFAAGRPGFVRLAGLTVSRLGFGGYRVDAESEEHRASLHQALASGLNLIDTSTNYTDGGSERLVGQVLAESDVPREAVVIVSKIGYVQGQNLALARRRSFPEMVEYAEGCWHCIHPEWLEDQLNRSLDRLGLETLDVCLLHNPEYFLAHALRAPDADLEALRDEFYRRTRQAFAFLEEEREKGRIAGYGVSSNNLVLPASHPHHTNLLRMLDGVGEGFQVVQFPLNLIESGAVLEANHDGRTLLEVCRERGLATLVNRPLNAFTESKLIRLADFEPDEDEETDLEGNLKRLQGLEIEWREAFGANVKGPGAEHLFRFADQLQGLPEALGGVEHWHQIEAGRIRPTLQAMVAAMNGAVGGPLGDAWVHWRNRYLDCFRELMNDFEELALARSQEAADEVAARVDPLIPEARRGETLSRKALWVAASTPGVTCVLNGMRTTDYVEDSVAVLAWEPLEAARPVYEACSG